jgi:hypothetical protein
MIDYKNAEWRYTEVSDVVPILNKQYYLATLQCPYCLDIGQYYIKIGSIYGRHCPYCNKSYLGGWYEI